MTAVDTLRLTAEEATAAVERGYRAVARPKQDDVLAQYLDAAWLVAKIGAPARAIPAVSQKLTHHSSLLGALAHACVGWICRNGAPIVVGSRPISMRRTFAFPAKPWRL